MKCALLSVGGVGVVFAFSAALLLELASWAKQHGMYFPKIFIPSCLYLFPSSISASFILSVTPWHTHIHTRTYSCPYTVTFLFHSFILSPLFGERPAAGVDFLLNPLTFLQILVFVPYTNILSVDQRFFFVGLLVFSPQHICWRPPKIHMYPLYLLYVDLKMGVNASIKSSINQVFTSSLSDQSLDKNLKKNTKKMFDCNENVSELLKFCYCRSFICLRLVHFPPRILRRL